MRIVFENDDCRRLAEDASFTSPSWGADIIKSYRKKIQVIRAATDERELYAMRSLRLEKLKGTRLGTSSIRLNDQFRLIIRFETDDEGRNAVVLEMVDYH